jgi:cytochrome c oxidase subunit II
VSPRFLLDGTVDTNPFHPGGPVDDKINSVYTPIFWISIVIFFGVAALIVYAAIRFRRRSDDDQPTQIHGNNRLELAWTAMPFLILATLFGWTAANMSFITSAPAGSMQVCVMGQRYSWTFTYENGCGASTQVKGENGDTKLAYPGTPGSVTAGKLYIPVGKPVALEVVSADVNHSFYIPRLAGQINAIPGQTNRMWLQADTQGRYFGQCTELCGPGHAFMELEVDAVPQNLFDQCMADLKQHQTTHCSTGGS